MNLISDKKKENNQGATLLLVLAIFVLLTVVSANMLMLVNAGNVKVKDEFDVEQRNLLIVSVFDTLDATMQRGIWNDAFGEDDPATITVTGFETVEGDALSVDILVERNRNVADVKYHITLPDGATYEIPVKYTCTLAGTPSRVTGLAMRECGEISLVTP